MSSCCERLQWVLIILKHIDSSHMHLLWGWSWCAGTIFPGLPASFLLCDFKNVSWVSCKPSGHSQGKIPALVAWLVTAIPWERLNFPLRREYRFLKYDLNFSTNTHRYFASIFPHDLHIYSSLFKWMQLLECFLLSSKLSSDSVSSRVVPANCSHLPPKVTSRPAKSLPKPHYHRRPYWIHCSTQCCALNFNSLFQLCTFPWAVLYKMFEIFLITHLLYRFHWSIVIKQTLLNHLQANCDALRKPL